jgi:hypothetical protein
MKNKHSMNKKKLSKKTQKVKKQLTKLKSKKNIRKNKKVTRVYQKGGDNGFEDEEAYNRFWYRTLTLDLNEGDIENTNTMKLRYGLEGDKIANLKSSITRFLQDKQILNVEALKDFFRQRIIKFYEDTKYHKNGPLFKDEYNNLDDIISVIKNNESVVSFATTAASSTVVASPTPQSHYQNLQESNIPESVISKYQVRLGNKQVVIIDMDLVFGDKMYTLCIESGKLVTDKCKCVDDISRQVRRKTGDQIKSEYFKPGVYDRFINLLNVLKTQGKIVCLTSSKLKRTILKAFIALQLPVTKAILLGLLRASEKDDIPIERKILNGNSCSGVEFKVLDKYLLLPEHLQEYTAQDNISYPQDYKKDFFAILITQSYEKQFNETELASTREILLITDTELSNNSPYRLLNKAEDGPRTEQKYQLTLDVFVTDSL